MTATTLKHFQADSVIDYADCGSWRQGRYFLDKASAYALEMALATRRPLLVKGEPGLGKSYLARAAAAKLKRKFIAEVVNINTEGQDLLWRYDPVARLNDAHAGIKDDDKLNPKHYLNPGVLWWTFGYESAAKQYNDVCRHKVYRPQISDDGELDNGIVLLIDEIDKAEPSLPNALLEVLGNGGFDVPLLEETIGKKQQTADKQPTPPLVIITSNDERELPAAFIRRCLVLHLAVDDKNLETWFLERAKVHFNDNQCSDAIKRLALQQLIADRQEAERHGTIKAGLAEYLDLLAALDEMTDSSLQGQERDAYQQCLLAEIQHFVLRKAL
ncbi:AAA family ATPase [Methylomonas sp. EFPC1]|uniref:AAA family ATPase n=1 Tax=Methylomonas sp. EFPC1 TaxID=2812647 RepID=UPI00196853EF|nr:AAA family ATPase [Methylomonas sp. EFPC1]QSB03107.1 AAA family ATPase [Methylomonas sp. EFPC1]